jgi:hypothetical protein
MRLDEFGKDIRAQQGRIPTDPGNRYGMILFGNGMKPPQDIGGIAWVKDAGIAVFGAQVGNGVVGLGIWTCHDEAVGEGKLRDSS